jgi:hypothetical protein
MKRISGAAPAMLLAMALSLSGCGNPGRKAGEDGSAVAGDKRVATDSAATPEPGALARVDGKVRIRLHNLDSIALTDIFVQWPADSARFDSLPAKAYTGYIAVDTAYRYAYIKAKAGKRVRICQPKDFVGESLLAPGRYTYAISPAGVLDEKDEKSLGFMSLELRIDKEHP